MKNKEKPEETIVEAFKKKFGSKVGKTRIERRAQAVKRNESVTVWIRIHRNVFKDAVRWLCDLQPFLHLAVVSGNDLGDDIEFIYHFSVHYGEPLKEIPINLAVSVPKKDLRLPTICDLIPGALVTEREKQEMFGVVIERIPDARRLFLPEDFPEGIYPWRKDEKGVPESMVKKLK